MKNILYKLLLLTIFFHFAFPKSGVKINNVPLTTGDVLYFILIIMFIFYIICKNSIKKNCLYVFIIFSIIISGVKIYYGYINKNDMLVNVIGYFVPLCVYPIIYIITNETITSKEELDNILKIIVYSFCIVSTYAIIQLIFGLDKTVIPGLTANLTDAKDPNFLMLKANKFGNFSKLVSTYQNGNILGANLVLFFPLVLEYLNKNKRKYANLAFILFSIVIILTLSRTAWFGYIIFILLRYFIFNNNIKFSFPRKKIVLYILIIYLIPISLFIIYRMPSVHARIFVSADSIMNLSGRLPGAEELINNTLLSERFLTVLIGPYGLLDNGTYGFAYEMTYLALYLLIGIIGLIIWLIPIIFSIILFIKNKNYITFGVLIGLLSWMMMANIEGAFWLPPTAFNLWFLLSLGYVSLRY